MIYHDSWLLAHSAPKGNSKFEILLVRVFSLRQKNKPNTSCSYRKNQILSLQENSLVFLQITNFIEISNYMFKYTRDFNGDIKK